jgi:hypothetical protein
MGWVSGTGNTTNRKKLLFYFSTEIYRIQQKCFLNVAGLCWHPLTRKGKQFGFRFSLIADRQLPSACKTGSPVIFSVFSAVPLNYTA